MTDNRFYHIAGCTCLGVAAAFAVLLSGCSGKNREEENMKDGRLKYEPQINLVEADILEKRDFVRELTANGRLSAVSRSSMRFRSSGIIREIAVKNGQRVEKGSIVALQDASEIELVLESAGLSLKKSELDFLDVLAGQGYTTSDTSSVPERIKKMARMRSGYDAALNSLRKAELDFAGTVLKAPFSGKIADIKLKEYDMSGTDVFCTIIDDSAFDVDFYVLESEYPFVEQGLEVKVIPFSGEARVLSGEIVSVNPTIDRNGQVAVKARVANDGTLVDGMNVKIAVGRIVEDMLVVPKSAVVIRDNEEVLFRTKEGKALWTYVHILMSNSTEHAVTANTDRGAVLAPGDSVIVSGNLNLADGSEVSVKR